MAEDAPLILVVDDDPDFVEMHQEILQSGGYRVVSAYEPEEALTLVAQQQPRLVVTDLMMSALDSGFSLARRIRAGGQRIPVIIVTSAGTRLGLDFVPRTPAELETMCADAFFAKPVQPERLLVRVRELLGGCAA